MLTTKPPAISKHNNEYSLTFLLNEDEIENICAVEEFMSRGGEFEIIVRKRPAKRSTDANAYAWKLISLISEKTGIPPIDVYRQQILNMYTYRDVLINKDEVDKEVNDWQRQGIGWLCEIVGPSREHEDYIWLRKYKGSSSFSSKEMSNFIDNIIFDAKELGIQTEPTTKIKDIKEKWDNADT